MLCIFLPCLSAIAALAFSFDGYVRAKWGAWGEGALFDAWPLAVTQALGLTGLAFLPLLLLPEQDAGDYNTKIEKRRYAKLTPGRSLFAPLVAIVTFATLPEVLVRVRVRVRGRGRVSVRVRVRGRVGIVWLPASDT